MNWIEEITKFAKENGLEFYHDEDVDYMRYTTIRLSDPTTQKSYKHVILTVEISSPNSCDRAVKEICYRAEKALL